VRAKAASIKRKPTERQPHSVAILRLYLTGHTAKSRAALANLTMLCQEYLPDQLKVQVINLIKTPQLGEGEQIRTVSELMPRLPVPMRDIIRNLAQEDQVFVGIDLSTNDGDDSIKAP
jgi:circadian clock protein KaiB